MNLFETIAQARQCHPQYSALRESAAHTAARAYMNSLAMRMGDPNGNFLRDFQGQGFHARLFELACFAYLDEAGLAVDRSHKCPDFLVTKGRHTIAVESVTTNPSEGQGVDISLEQLEPLSEEEMLKKVAIEFPRRVSRTLLKKLRHDYHALPHCEGKPLVLMLAPFFEAGSVFYTDDALTPLLFGAPYGADNAAPAFFQNERASTISAVLYCNPFTVPRFFRMATDFLSEGAPVALREGFCYREYSLDANVTESFRHWLGSPDIPKENWAEGVTLFENPFAITPLPCDTLPASCRIFVKDGYVRREVGDFHPIVSTTIISGLL